MANQWAAGLTPAWALELRAGFDADAEVYQRTRPVCPPALFDDLIRLAGLSPGDRVLEIALARFPAVEVVTSSPPCCDRVPPSRS